MSGARWRGARLAAALGGRCCIGALALALLGGAGGARAQAAPDESRSIAGRVLTPAADTLRGVAGAWVVLHRVGRDTAGALDSTRTARDGGFRLHARQREGDDAIFFVSAMHDGIAYFSPALPPGNVSGDAAEIVVYDTVSAGIPLQQRGWHVVVSGAGVDGMHDIVEVYEISNDSARTLVSPDERAPTWTTVLPEAATDFQVGQGDVPADAVHVERGRVTVDAPFAPGLKQFSFAYKLPASAFPLSLPIQRATGQLEVFLEDEAATVTGAGLAPAQPANVQGRTFRRFLASDVPANSVVRVTQPALVTSRRSLYVALVLIGIMAAMLIALARTFRRRATAFQAAPLPGVGVSHGADVLAREIAALDEAFEAQAAPSDEARRAYTHRRAVLKERLTRALAAEQRTG